ncbi:hypothetical protein [Bacillus sp. FJAT-27445]|uniref:hypothetical protein n=1 Tax=Bacillus sp. FJAT-27445 TaxID=1679166 RepID=UPI0007437886|nr:hypothetical protein [Bacillus sp. FJAT-27445]
MVRIKKYIIPAAIVLLSIFFLNNEIESKKEDKLTRNEKTLPVLELINPSGDKTEPVLLARELVAPGELSSEAVAEAARNADALVIEPYSEAGLIFSKKEKSLSVTEWDRETGEESEKLPNNILLAGGTSGVKILIIRIEWPESGPATYVARVKIKKIYSYQDLLSRDREKYTVFKLLPPEDEELDLPPVNKPLYEERRIGWTLEQLQLSFPELEITILPSYFVFHKGIKVAATEDESELHRFLNETITITHAGQGENWEAELIAKHKLGEGVVLLAMQYIGTEKPIPSEISFNVQGTEWNMDQYIEELDAAGQALLSFDFKKIIRKEDKISLTMKWSGKEEMIYLTHKINLSSLEPKVSIKAKVSKLTDEQYGEVGTTGLENPQKDDFRYFTFNLKTSDSEKAIQKIDFPIASVFKRAIDNIDGKERYWYGNGYRNPDGEEHWESVFYSKGLSEVQIRKAFDLMFLAVHFTNGKKEYKLGDYLQIEE